MHIKFWIMPNKKIDTQKITQFAETISSANNIAITCHMSPDGDAIGACNAFCLLLNKLGKTANVITPDQAPYDLAFAPGYDNMTAYTRNPSKAARLIKNADLILCLDYNGLKRVAQMGDLIRYSKAKKVLIDHHLHPEEFCDLTISYPSMSSTCELIFCVLNESGLMQHIDTQIAECLYLGMMTDTGNFSYNSNDPDLYVMVSELVKKGINKDRIYKLAFNTINESRMRLVGYAIAEKMIIYPESKASLIALKFEDLNKFNYQSGDTETLANMPLAIPNVIWSTFFREEKDYIKVSMRSEGDFKVNTLCQTYFNGGGHANAAGGEFKGTMEEAIATYHQVLEDLKKQQIASDNEN